MVSRRSRVRVTAHRLALGLCLYLVLLGVAYAYETPIFEAPDEGAHFLYIHNLLETGQLPVLEDRSVVFASRSVQRHHPPLYYALGAALVAWTDRDDVDDYFQDNPFGAIGFVSENNQNIYLHSLSARGDTAVAVWVLRLYSLALGAGTIWLIFRTGQIAFPGQPVGLLAAAFTLSIPGFVANSASVNNDNLVTFLFTAGVYLCLRSWRQRALPDSTVVALSLILAASALSKLTGLALFPLVYGAAAWGALRGRYSWRCVVRLVAVSLLVAAVLSGWWYVRNWQLYGDPLALWKTLRIWGRGPAVSEGVSEILFEAKGVWDSFWMTLGHLNIRGPEWLYGYVPLLTLLGFAGAGIAFWRFRGRARDSLLLLLATIVLIVAALVMATRQINVSQGRILYPGLVGFAPLMALGWRTVLGRALAPVLIAPLAALALVTPAVYLDEAFAELDVVSELPPDAHLLDVRAETMTLVGYKLLTPLVRPGERVALDIYFRGQHPANPAFFVKALDPTTQETLGGVDLYPGMLPTRETFWEFLQRARVDFTIDPEQAAGRGPLRLSLVFGWRVLEPEPGRYLQWVDVGARPLDLVSVDGPTLLSAALDTTTAASADVTFGGALRLSGYSIPAEARAGDTLRVETRWEALQPVAENYTLTIGLLDARGQLVAQADGEIPGYPTSAWIVGEPFVTGRDVPLPADLPPGSYQVYVGWYTLPDVTRLPAVGASVQSDVALLAVVDITAG